MENGLCGMITERFNARKNMTEGRKTVIGYGGAGMD